MEQDQTPSPTPSDAISRGYETGDVHLSWVMIAICGLVALAAVIFVILWFVLKADAKGAKQLDVPRSVVTDHVPTAGSPLLQPTPANDVEPEEDLESMRQQEDKVFADLGWNVDLTKHRAQPPEALLRAVASKMNARRAPATQGATP